jgi:hypothetical protein
MSNLLRNLLALSALWLLSSMALAAGVYIEKNVRIITVRESGFGPEGKAEKYAGIKLDTKAALAPVCAWDVIAFDPSTDVGKVTLQELTAVATSKSILKSVSYTKDTEGDCYLSQYEK